MMFMDTSINVEVKGIRKGAVLPDVMGFENEPWAFFHTAGGFVRGMKKAVESNASWGAKSFELFNDLLCDEEASSRMEDEGCPNF